MKIINYKSIQLVFVLGYLISVAGCKSSKITRLNKEFIPIVSIDSTFKFNTSQNEKHAKRLTDATSKLLDSISNDNTLRFAPNYKFANKVKANYSVSAQIGLVKFPLTKQAVNGFIGYLTDNSTLERTLTFACYGKNDSDPGCFAYDIEKQDSTDYNKLSTTLLWGLRAVRNLVPIHQLLTPINSTSDDVISISLNKSVYALNKEDRDNALLLTDIINNTLVFNQSSYKRSVIKRHTQYNYYNNYYRKKAKRRKADYEIAATLTRTDDGKYELLFKFGGKDVNLIAPTELKTSILFDRVRFINNDYSEAMVEITELVYSFILMNTMFNGGK